MSTRPIRVAVTGGAGQICYDLLFRVAAGELFGADRPVVLNILELPAAMRALECVAMELDDCAFPLLAGINLTDDVGQAMKGVNWALLVGSKPRGPGMERGDLIRENGPIFVGSGRALNNAADDVRILTVGNPCNTNCLIAMHNATDVPKDRFHAMTRLDQNRAMHQLARKSGTTVNDIDQMIIWGNHSAKQVPDYMNARIAGRPATEVIGDLDYLRGEFIDVVSTRGTAILKARGKSSVASAASSAADAVRSLSRPSSAGEIFSSAVISDGNPYGIPDDLIFSFPCKSKGDGNWEIVPGYEWDEFLKSRIDATVEELLEEREVIKELLG